MINLKLFQDDVQPSLSTGALCDTAEEQLAQRFLLWLLTAPADMPHIPRGSHFLSKIQRAENEIDIASAFTAIKYSLRDGMRAEEPKKLNPRLKYHSAKIRKIEIGDGLVITFTVRSIAGMETTISTPPIHLEGSNGGALKGLGRRVAGSRPA